LETGKIKGEEALRIRQIGRERPEFWIEQVLNCKLTDYQVEIIKSVFKNKRTAVRSCSGAGKSFEAAGSALCFLYNYRPSTVITTAPCYDELTEILTDKGWRYFSMLDGSEKVATLVGSRELKFEKPLDYIKYAYQGELIGYNSQHLDFLVTPVHRCFVKKRWQKEYSIKSAESLYGKWQWQFKRDTEWNGEDDGWTESHYELWGFWFAEGYSQRSTKRNRVTLTQKNYPEYAEGLLSVYTYKVHREPRSNGGYNFTIYSKDLAGWFEDHFKVDGVKHIPSWIRNSTVPKLKAFIKGYIMGDGHLRTHKDDQTRITTSIEGLADSLQEICLKAGYVTNKSWCSNKGNGEYKISFLRHREHPRSRGEHWYKQPYNGFVYCVKTTSGIIMVRRNGKYHWSGNTFRQVESILWREIAVRHGGAKLPLDGNLTSTKLELAANWFALGMSTDDPVRFQGFHNANILVISDEASGLPEDIYTALENPMSTGNAHELLIGNPTQAVGGFRRAFDSESYEKFHISAFDTPNLKEFGITIEDIRSGDWKDKVEGKELPYPSLISPYWVAEQYREWGEGSYHFQVYIMGNFPPAGVNTLFRLQDVEAAMKRGEDEIPAKGSRVAALDVSRYGDDETVYGERVGDRVLTLTGWSHMETTYTAGRTLRLVKVGNPDNIIIDAVGVGGGVADMLKEELGVKAGLQLVEFNSGGTARDKETFGNRRAEVFWDLARRTQDGRLALPKDDKLKAQLCDVRYRYDSHGKIWIESKEEMRSRGTKSPDRADTVMMLFAPEVLHPFGKFGAKPNVKYYF
jgi:hypothetical protein